MRRAGRHTHMRPVEIRHPEFRSSRNVRPGKRSTSRDAANKSEEVQVAETEQRNPLRPWVIGLIIIVISDIYIAYLFFSTQCQAPAIAQFLVLIVVPVVYLVLMYLTLKSQP
jgi:hypothetical protein